VLPVDRTRDGCLFESLPERQQLANNFDEPGIVLNDLFGPNIRISDCPSYKSQHFFDRMNRNTTFPFGISLKFLKITPHKLLDLDHLIDHIAIFLICIFHVSDYANTSTEISISEIVMLEKTSQNFSQLTVISRRKGDIVLLAIEETEIQESFHDERYHVSYVSGVALDEFHEPLETYVEENWVSD
jgi:hypothetical protein